jgi:IS605 OrfB family transposase
MTAVYKSIPPTAEPSRHAGLSGFVSLSAGLGDKRDLDALIKARQEEQEKFQKFFEEQFKSFGIDKDSSGQISDGIAKSIEEIMRLNKMIDNTEMFDRLGLNQSQLDLSIFLTYALLTLEAVSLASGSILHSLLTELACLHASRAYDGNNARHKQGSMHLLFHLWIVAENETQENAEFVIAKGSDERAERSRKVASALLEILNKDGLSDEQAGEWLSVLKDTLCAETSGQAVFVNRRSMAAKAKQIHGGGRLGENGAMDIFRHFFNGIEPLINLFAPKTEKPEGTEGPKEPAEHASSALKKFFTGHASQLYFSRRFGLGEGADFPLLSSMYSTVEEWAGDSLNAHGADPETGPSGKNAGPPSTEGLLDFLFSRFPKLSDLKIKPGGTRIGGLITFLCRSGHSGPVTAMLRELEKTGAATPLSSEQLGMLKKRAKDEAERCAREIGDKGPQEYSTDMMELASKICGVPFSGSGPDRRFYTLCLEEASTRLASHLTAVAGHEAERQALASSGARKLEETGENAIGALEHVCAGMKSFTGRKGPYLLNQRDLFFFKAALLRLKNRKCATKEEIACTLSEFKEKSSIRSENCLPILDFLLDYKPLPGKPGAGFDLLRDLTPKRLFSYAEATRELFKATDLKIPMLRHFHPFLSPAALRFGGAYLKVEHDDRRNLDGPCTRVMTVTLWNGSSFRDRTVRWRSDRVREALALDNRGKGPPVSLATRKGRLAAGLDAAADCQVEGLFCKRANWPITILPDREALEAIGEDLLSQGVGYGDGLTPPDLKAIKYDVPWHVHFHIKAHYSGPLYDFAEKNDVPVSKSGGFAAHMELNSKRGYGARIGISRHPEGLRVLSVDVGLKNSAACTITVTCSKETVEAFSLRHGAEPPNEDDLHHSVVVPLERKRRSKKDSGTRTVLFRRTGPDFFPGGSVNPSPWLKVESQFFLRLDGEREGDKRNLSTEEMEFIHNVQANLGMTSTFLTRNYNNIESFGRSGGPSGQKKSPGIILSPALLELLEASDPALDKSCSKDQMSHTAITAYRSLVNDLANAYKDISTLARTIKVLVQDSQDSSEMPILTALEALRLLGGHDSSAGKLAKTVHDQLSSGLPLAAPDAPAGASWPGAEGEMPPAARHTGLSFGGGLLERPCIPAGQARILEEQILQMEMTLDKSINEVKDALFPSRRSELSHSIRNMGGLSVERIEALSGLVYRVIRPFARYLHAKDGSTDPHGFDIKQISLTEVDAIRNIKTERLRLLESLVIRAAQDDIQDTWNPAGRRRLHVPDRRKFCHYIVIENLGSLRPSEERTRRENRTIAQLRPGSFCELLASAAPRYGIGVLLVNPAMTSRMDSKTGGFGIRVSETTPKIFMKTPWIQARVAEARERAANGMPFEEDRLWTEVADRLGSLSPSRLAKEKNVFYPDKGGPLFLSCHQGPAYTINADLNASLNIAVRGLSDPDFEGSHFRVLTDMKGVPDRQRYKGSLVIAEGKPLVDGVQKSGGAEARGGKAKIYLWRLPSCAPINSSSKWLRTWDFYDLVMNLAVEKLLKRLHDGRPKSRDGP